MHFSSELRKAFCSIALLMAFLLSAVGTAQIQPAVGIRQNTPDVHAFVNAKIVLAPGKVVEKGTLLVRGGIIEAVGPNVPVPPDARVWDMTGMTIYAGFIDSYSDIGMPKKPQPGDAQEGMRSRRAAPAASEQRGPKHWNDNVLSSQNADELFMPDPKAAEKMRGIGFTTAHVVPQMGILRGSTALFSLGDGTANQLLVKSHIAQDITFEISFGSGYPNSLMGAIALIRQTMLDAQWQKMAMKAAAEYPNEPRPEFVSDLAALEDAMAGKQPIMFESTDEISILRAEKIAKEFSVKSWMCGSGYEYRQIDAVKQTGAPILLPVNFPDAPSVQVPEEAINIDLEELRYWDEAPENPRKLQEAGITFAFTTAKLKDADKFLGNLRTAVKRGLSPEAALAALTVTPAKLFGVEKRLGTLEQGKMANFVVTDGDLFSEKTKIRETWVDGKRYPVKPRPEFEPRGTWETLLTNTPIDTLTIVLKGEIEKPEGSVKAKGKEAKFSTVTFSDMRISFSFTGDSLGLKGVIRMTGTAGGETMLGTGELSDGSGFSWSAMRKSPFKQEPDTSKPKPPAMASFGPVYPPGSFGRAKPPEQPASILVKDATVWTCGPEGTIQHGDVLIEHGKIQKVGQNLKAPSDALVINAGGKHVTPGVIDCHSHTAVEGGVNETGKTITAEVRIGDVIDPYDIAVYRELAGGTTAANVLHGSANPIGGQNQVIKLRWGMLPEEMKFEGAPPGIKFALGENPKESNWGGGSGGRYPQTREGVEQIIRDEFHAALDYEKATKEFQDGKRHIPVRRDLELDAVVEILHGYRLVHAHSYRQDEIEMLMRVAEDFGFRIGTFQHVLEGYKIADQLAKHGAGASTFSDWWAYKFEVYDAIPYNGALMHDATVVVSYNSDSDEQARRLNTEAAKAVKYGGVSEEEALKFVTLNPAKQLRIDNRVGSLEPGKDADFVIWSGSPLSTYSICEQTWIDGRKYFDRDEDRKMNEEVRKERATLIQKMLAEKKPEGGVKKPEMPRRPREGANGDDGARGKEGN